MSTVAAASRVVTVRGLPKSLATGARTAASSTGCSAEARSAGDALRMSTIRTAVSGSSGLTCTEI